MQPDISFVQPGMDVAGSDLKRIGRVRDATPQYILIDRQHLIRHHDLYVPRDAIQEVSEGDRLVILSVPAADVDGMRWDEPPRREPTSVAHAPADVIDGGTRVRDVLTPAVDTVRVDEPVKLVQRRMEGEALRSLIAVAEGRPVGVVQWRDVQRAADTEQPIREVMRRTFPVVEEDMTLEEARARFGDVDFDRIPVVNADDMLVGEVMRADVVRPAPAKPTDQLIAEGMKVVGSAGHQLGTVSETVVSPTGQIQGFVVAHGLLGRKHKQLPPSVIDHTEGETLVLNIDTTEFKILADREDHV